MIKWSELTPREKIEHIVRDVLRWKYFPEWDIKHTARWALEGEVKWPYAFWNGPRDGICVFYTPNEYARPFNPLESMSDAWQVVEHITRPPQSREEALQAANTRFGFWFDKANLWSYSAQEAAEAICLAALRACGIEVH